MFATGNATMPPMGFHDPPVITILQNESIYPNANTCPKELELPGCVSTLKQVWIQLWQCKRKVLGSFKDLDT